MSEIAFLIAGFFISLFVAWKLSRTRLYSERVVFDALLLTMFGALIGARTVFVLFHFSGFGFNVLKWIVIGLYPGLSAAGALLGIAVAWWMLSDKKTVVPFPELADLLTRTYLIIAPIVLTGLFVTGKSSIYRVIAILVIAGLTQVIFRKKYVLANGTYSAWIWFWLILSYFFIDFLKQVDVYYWKFSVDQWIYSVLWLVAGIVLIFQKRQKTFFAIKK